IRLCAPLYLALFPYTTLFRSALIAFGLTCLLIGVFCVMTTFFAMVMRSAAVALFATIGFFFVCSTALDMLASQYTFFADILKYRSEEHTSELQSRFDLVCRLL